jgi:hypothetical protein
LTSEAEEAIEFISTNQDKPFFLNYGAFSVHAPFDGRKDLIKSTSTKQIQKIHNTFLSLA